MPGATGAARRAQQLARELAHRLAARALEVLPRLAAELGERRRGRVGADVARDLAELLVRDVEPVVAAEREEEVVARDAGDLLRLEAEQLADAVVLVHDEVAGAQVGERLRARGRDARPRAAAACGRPACRGAGRARARARRSRAARARPRSEAARVARQLVARVEQLGVDAAEQVLLPQRLAAVREGDDDPLAGAHEGASSFSASLRPRAAIAGRCASNANGWPCGNGSSSAVPSRLDGRSPSSSQTRRTSSGCQTRSGTRSSTGTRSSPGRPRRSTADAGRGAARRPGRRRVVDRMERALRERRERAHPLDLVAEELDAERLPAGRREDVDEPAADGELAALLDALDALVARERERLPPGRRRPARRRPRAAPARAARQRRQAFGERRGGGADEPARREHVERPGALADEVRRRLEAGVPADAAAREQRDALRPRNQPAASAASRASASSGRSRTSGRSSCSCSAASSRGQRRLRDARARRQRRGEGGEALVGDEGANERVEERTVHDDSETRSAACDRSPGVGLPPAAAGLY